MKTGRDILGGFPPSRQFNHHQMRLARYKRCPGRVDYVFNACLSLIFIERENPRKHVGHALNKGAAVIGCNSNELRRELKKFHSRISFEFGH